jgi:hypothetical protein
MWKLILFRLPRVGSSSNIIYPPNIALNPQLLSPRVFVGLAYQGKDIVFRFIIEYSSLRDFGP